MQPNQQAGSNSFVAADGTPLDPTAATLARALRQTESGGNYNATGKSGERGAYQWMPGVFEQMAKENGLDPADFSPTNQDKVAYKHIEKLLKQGHKQSEIASYWNSGSFNPQGKVGTNKQGVRYNTPSYVANVESAYKQIAGGGMTPQPSVPNASTPPAGDNGGINTALAAETGKEIGSKPNGVIRVVKGVGNALFPIVGDLSATAKGEKVAGKKLLADAVLSALPFVPGLGEIGLVGKGASALAKVGAVAAEGYGIGALQNISQGKSVGESLKPGYGTLGGAALGAGTAGLLRGASSFAEKASGIPENLKPVLSNISNPKLYDEYINAAKARATDIRNASPLELAADYTKKAVTKMQERLTNKFGPAVGQAKNLEGTKPLQSLTPVLKNFASNLESKFGLKISANATGQKIFIDRAEGRMKDILSPADQNRVKKAMAQLLSLRKGGNLRKASDVVDNLDSLVDYSKKDLLGHSNDPLEGFLKGVRHDLNGVIKESSPKLAKAKAQFHELSDALQEISGAGGDNLQRAELLLKRVLAGDKSEASRKVFDIIKRETGIDLVEHAVLADHAIRTIKDPSQVSLLNKMIENVAQGGQPTMFGTGLDIGRAALRKTFANPERIGRNLTTKKAPGIKGLLRTALPREAARVSSVVSQ